MKKPKAKPAGSSATEGGGEGDAVGEKDEGDNDEVEVNKMLLSKDRGNCLNAGESGSTLLYNFMGGCDDDFYLRIFLAH